MDPPRRIPLNPCDYLYFAHHSMTRRAYEGGNVAFMMIDAAGRAEPARVRRALAAAIAAHPVVMARTRVTWLKGRPCWVLRGGGRTSAQAAERAHQVDDLRADADWERQLERLCQERFVPDWRLPEGPHVRLEQYELPDDRTRFCLRWPHYLMDAEGAQWFLAEIGRFDDGGSAALDRHGQPRAAVPQVGPGSRLPVGLLPDGQAHDPLRTVSLRRRLALSRASYSSQRRINRLPVRPLFEAPVEWKSSYRYLHRVWHSDAVERIRSNAKRTTPPGPGLYARFLAACVFRALHRVYTERGVETGAYLLPLPMRVGAAGGGSGGPFERPVHGNYLVATTLCALRHMAEDRDALGAELLRQLEAYMAQRGDLAHWTMIWSFSKLRLWQYRVLLKLPLGLERYASGFSYYGEIARPVRTIGGARVTNVWGCAPMGVPPGWNPAFSRFGDRLNFSLSWVRPYVPDDAAAQFADLVEREALRVEPA